MLQPQRLDGNICLICPGMALVVHSSFFILLSWTLPAHFSFEMGWTLSAHFALKCQRAELYQHIFIRIGLNLTSTLFIRNGLDLTVTFFIRNGLYSTQYQIVPFKLDWTHLTFPFVSGARNPRRHDAIVCLSACGSRACFGPRAPASRLSSRTCVWIARAL
jgi:hypothetical protein